MSETLSLEEYLASHGSLTYTNVGTSMMPLLREGRDLFTVVPKKGRCRVGDVVLYRRPPSSWVLHRIVGVLADGYLTLGDNCAAREFVAEGDVVGVMSGFVRSGRKRAAFFPAFTRIGKGTGGCRLCGFARRSRGGRAHSVDEVGYRAYTRAVLVTERPRVLFKRALWAARQRVSKVVRHAR